jgi:hypothetical protein
MTQPSMGDYVKDSNSSFFDTLTNTHPNMRRVRTIGQDPRNDQDYDTFDYGSEPLPGDTTWAKMARIRAGLRPQQFKNNHYTPQK